MAIFETVLKSDLKKPVQIKQLSGYLFSGDNQGNKISVEVMDNGSPATLTGGVTGYVIREDNATVTILNGTLSGNKASIVLPKEAYNVIGRVSIVVKVGTVTVGACTSYVYKTSTDTLVDPTGAIPSLQELLAKISACEQATADANKVANLTVSAETATGSTPDAVLSETGSPAHKHITFKLVKGDKGDTGNTGATPQLSIGTVTTLQPSQDATVTITGTDEEPVLNFGIPQGASGNETIDDTAGIGDTDLVYSADKVVKLFKEEHEHLTAGSALQLLGQYTDENVPYVFRKTPVNSKRVREKLVGGTIAWNQLAGYNASAGSTIINDVTFTINSDGSVTVNGTASAKTSFNCGTRVAIPSGHKTFVRGCPSGGSYETYYFKDGYQNTYETGNGRIDNTTTYTIGQIVIQSGYQANNLKFKPQIYDLTAMFGSTIADAIYAMETATPGSGVAWFRSLFQKDYYEYNAGELMSVQAGSKVTTGFNQWDEEWENGYYSSSTGTFYSDSRFLASKNKIKVIPGSDYYFKSPAHIEFFGYDVNGNYLRMIRTTFRNGTQTIPSDVYFITFNSSAQNTMTTYNHDICINLSDPSKNGTYEPYEAPHTYPFDSDLVLRGIPKWDSTSGKMYYDGDEYEADGKVTRKYGIVDMGTLTWNKSASNSFYASVSDKKYPSYIAQCSKYPAYTSSTDSLDIVSHPGLIGQNYTNTYIFIYDANYASGTAEAFKTAMSGVYLVYELATPTTETADPYHEIQICDGNGTEEFVDGGNRDVAVPVGHASKYSADIWQIIADLQAAILALGT